ncbi:MAG: hypothetical protein V4496_05545, partial [Pseudomonadota bacterium]
VMHWVETEQTPRYEEIKAELDAKYDDKKTLLSQDMDRVALNFVNSLLASASDTTNQDEKVVTINVHKALNLGTSYLKEEVYHYTAWDEADPLLLGPFAHRHVLHVFDHRSSTNKAIDTLFNKISSDTLKFINLETRESPTNSKNKKHIGTPDITQAKKTLEMTANTGNKIEPEIATTLLSPEQMAQLQQAIDSSSNAAQIKTIMGVLRGNMELALTLSDKNVDLAVAMLQVTTNNVIGKLIEKEKRRESDRARNNNQKRGNVHSSASISSPAAMYPMQREKSNSSLADNAEDERVNTTPRPAPSQQS